jgi:hypothetical protein
MKLDEEISENPRKEPAKQKPALSEEFQKWAASLEDCALPEEKIKLMIEAMEVRIDEDSSPKFREFWALRNLCLPVFKAMPASLLRTELWQQYVDLSVKARRLKASLEEKSSFAYEQIDLAIVSLEQDLAKYEEKILQMPDLDSYVTLEPLSQKKDQYGSLFKEMQLLNVFATKINALRKEAIHTEMRVRNKHKLFDRLSTCGNQVFPKRKEHIKKVSRQFTQDILAFSEIYFLVEKKPGIPLYVLQEEIKILQDLAKKLTLNSQAFLEVRKILSGHWDDLKRREKEKKQEFVQKKQQEEQSHEKALEKVQEFEKFCQDNPFLKAIQDQFEEVFASIKSIADLSRDSEIYCKERMMAPKRALEDVEKLKRLEIGKKEKEQKTLRLQQFQELQADVQKILEEGEKNSLETLTVLRGEFEERIANFVPSKTEKMVIDRLMRSFKDLFLESKRRSLGSHLDQERYEEIQTLLQDKKARRQEIKEQIELYRKAIGGSTLDFEKSMLYQEWMESEKKVLEKMNISITELEEQIE